MSKVSQRRPFPKITAEVAAWSERRFARKAEIVKLTGQTHPADVRTRGDILRHRRKSEAYRRRKLNEWIDAIGEARSDIEVRDLARFSRADRNRLARGEHPRIDRSRHPW